MCGRFTKNYTWEQVRDYMDLTPQRAPSNFPPDFNVCPTDPVDAVIKADQGRELIAMRWGIIPNWWSRPIKDLSKYSLFNARSEEVETKKMFRDAWEGKQRCIIPASGFYEWQLIGKIRQPWYLTSREEPILAIAGIWDSWKEKETGKTVQSCAMMITEPNKFIAEFHDRMPVLLDRSQFGAWLSGETDKELLKPAPEDLLQRWPVSTRVNSSRAPHDDASLVDKVNL